MKQARKIVVIKRSGSLFSAGEEIPLEGKFWITDRGNLSTPQGVVERDDFYVITEESNRDPRVDPFEVF